MRREARACGSTSSSRRPSALGSRARAVAALERGKVFVNDREVTLADAATRARGRRRRAPVDGPAGQRQAPPRPAPQSASSTILYEDEALIVVNKPAGLLAVPLERKSDAPSVYDRSRITSGRAAGGGRSSCIGSIATRPGWCCSRRTRAAQARLKEQFKRREPERVYWAVVYGHPTPPPGTWRDHLVWDQKALIQKETHPRDPRGTEAISRLSRRSKRSPTRR